MAKAGPLAATRWRIAAIGTGLYLVVFGYALIYPLFDRRTFSGLVPVLLGWPWIDHLSSGWFPLAIVLNAIVIFCGLAALSFAPSFIRRLRKQN